LTIWHCINKKTNSFRLFFFADFAHGAVVDLRAMNIQYEI